MASMTDAALSRSRVLSLSEWLERVETALLAWEHAPRAVTLQIQDLRARLADQRLTVAVVGQFKRGKSTLLNALLGASVAPSGILPLTAVPVFVTGGQGLRLRVTHLDQHPASEIAVDDDKALAGWLKELVSEDQNPGNRLGIDTVEITYPAAILANGVTLIDTPGIGSTLEHNTETTVAILPRCDTALFVVSPDPPITKQEMEFLKLVRPQVQRIVVVLNKIDLLASADRDVAIGFLRRTLNQAGLESHTPIIAVSAAKALKARQENDTAGLAESGLPALERCLSEGLFADKDDLVSRSITAKARQALDLCRTSTLMSLRGYEIELDELDRRLGAFDQALAKIELERFRTRDIATGDRNRLLEMLEAEAEKLRGEAEGRLQRSGEDVLAKGSSTAEAMAAIHDEIPEVFNAALRSWQKSFNVQIGHVLERHAAALDVILEEIQTEAASIFEVRLPAFKPARFATMEKDPYWVVAKIDAIFAPVVAGMLDRVLPGTARRRRDRRRLLERCHELVLHNVENLRWATLQNIDSAFRRFSAEFDDRISYAVAATKGAIQAAVAERRDFAGRGERRVSQLRDRIASLDELMRQTSGSNLITSADERSTE